MITQYGEIADKDIQIYLKKLIGRVYKILPMAEEECLTLESYIDSLIRELIGNSKIFAKIFVGDGLLVVIGTLEGLNFDNHDKLRSDILKITNIVGKIDKKVLR